MKFINYKGSNIKYSKKGSGPTLFFIHGYMSSSEAWETFAPRFIENFTVILIDLPGHGLSENIKTAPSIQTYTDCIIAILDKENILKASFIGHSMGGYIIMDLIKNHENRINSFILINTHPFADSPKKKEARNKEAMMIRNGKKELLVSLNNARLFFNNNENERIIERIKNISINTSNDGCDFALEAMRKRDDSSETLLYTCIPFLIIFSLHDNQIDYKLIENLEINQEQKILLNASSHFCFIEEADLCERVLKNLFDKHLEF
ncbi:MAG: alpha/beta hydrolase [Bacteroidales bacterium]|nr:alpha/beta hydrolase [Bacteroidales bacterium]